MGDGILLHHHLGVEDLVLIHAAVRRIVTPARSGPVTRLPKAWQAEQPLVWRAFSPCSASAASIGVSPARGPWSYFETASGPPPAADPPALLRTILVIWARCNRLRPPAPWPGTTSDEAREVSFPTPPADAAMTRGDERVEPPRETA
jgi:hypothetical protein